MVTYEVCCLKYEEELARERVGGGRKESGKQDPFLWAQREGTRVLPGLVGTKVACAGVAAGEAAETGGCGFWKGVLMLAAEPALGSESLWCLRRS